jgi:hypothetical protein
MKFLSHLIQYTATKRLLVSISALLCASSVTQAVIRSVSDPAGTYNLRDSVQIAVELVGPQVGGQGQLRVEGRDIYGNLIDQVVATATIPNLAGAGANQQPETATVTFQWQIPNDGTLYNTSEGGYSLIVEIPSGDPATPITERRSGVRIDVTPNLVLSEIQVAPGTYRAGDIIQIAASITNLERSGNQTRPLRPTISDEFRTELLLTRDPALDRTNDFLLGFFTTRGSSLGLGPDLSDLPDGRSPIRKIEVGGTPSLINSLGRDYSPQPDDGFLDRGETMKVFLEVMIPWNFEGEYFVGGVVDSLEQIAETFEPDNTLVNALTPQIRIISSDEPKVEPVSERTSPDGQLLNQSNGASDNAAVSEDGEWVVFDSFATNLDPDVPGNGNRQIYLRNTRTRAVKLISRSSSGQLGNNDSVNPVISGNGRFIAYESRATNLVSGAQGAASHIFIYDRFLERTRRVSVNSDGLPANGSAFNPSISADGRFVVFRSTATNLDPAFSGFPSSEQVFLHDRDVNGSGDFDNNFTSRMVSIGVDGNPANHRAFDARISMDGDIVVFVSRASNLSLNYSDIYTQIWYREIDPNGIPTGQVQIVSLDNLGNHGNGNSSDPVVNAGRNQPLYGLQIAFVSEANNLVANDTNGVADVFVRDFSDPNVPVTNRVSVSNPRVSFGRIFFTDPGLAVGTVVGNRPDTQPSDGDEIILNDGINLPVTLTFRNLAVADTDVQISPISSGFTRNNLVETINSLADNGRFNFYAYSSNPPPGLNPAFDDGLSPGVTIFNTVPGSHGNIDIIVNPAGIIQTVFSQGMDEGGTEAIDWIVAGSELGSLQPSIDRSGRLIAFRTLARNLSVIRDFERIRRAPGEAETPGVGEIIRPLYRSATSNVYLRDRDLTGQGQLDLTENTDTSRVSVNPFGYPTNRLLNIASSGSSRGPALSANGRFIAFATDSENTAGLRFGRTNTQPLDTNGRRDIFIFDRASVVPIVPVVENPPFITITSPIAGSSISSTSPFFISASAIGFDETTNSFNQGSIARVTFFVNGEEEVSITQAPFATLATPRGEGPLRIFAIAEDSKGNTSRSATVEILASNLPFSTPNLILLNPNATINTQFSLGENVDLVSRIVSTAGNAEFLQRYSFVRALFYVNALEVFSTTERTDLITASYTFERLGTQNLTAAVIYRLRDEFSGPRFVNIFSDQVMVNVIAEASPSIVFTTPRNGNAVALNDSLSLSARPTAAAGGDMSVEYFLISETDASVVSLGTADASTNYSLDWTIDKLGALSLFAVVEETVAPGDVRRSTSQRVDIVSAVRDNLPSVAIESLATTAPLTQVESGSVVQLRANARGENGNANDVQSVAFFVNGQFVGAGSRIGTSSTYELEWLPTIASGLSDMRGTITAEVTSTANELSVVSAPVFVEIVRGNNPVVTINSPTAAQAITIGQELPFIASASVAGGTISEVAFYSRNTPGNPTSGNRFGADSSSPYTGTFSSPSTGEFYIYAVATSQSGRSTASAPVFVLVTEGVILTNPVDTNFINDIYERLLGRLPSSAELNNALLTVSNGRDDAKATFLMNLIGASEFEPLIASAYLFRSMTGRWPRQEELSTSLATLNTQGESGLITELIPRFAGFNSLAARQFVEKMFSNKYGVAPTNPGLQTDILLARLNGGQVGVNYSNSGLKIFPGFFGDRIAYTRAFALDNRVWQQNDLAGNYSDVLGFQLPNSTVSSRVVSAVLHAALLEQDPTDARLSALGSLDQAQLINRILQGYQDKFANATSLTDFNGDGNTDILWRNMSNGDVAVWQMVGSAVQLSEPVARITDRSNWQIVGTGDFNRDGRTDIVWHNSAAGQGQVVAWLMEGKTIRSAQPIGRVSNTSQWRIAAVADFTGNGSPDILWRHQGTGIHVAWVMSGSRLLGYRSFAQMNNSDWHIAATGDLNNNGKLDLIWQNRFTGNAVVWYLDEFSIVGSAILQSEGADWQIVGTGDFDRDGKTDILWRNQTTGETKIELMDNAIRRNQVRSLDTVPSQWQIFNR